MKLIMGNKPNSSSWMFKLFLLAMLVGFVSLTWKGGEPLFEQKKTHLKHVSFSHGHGGLLQASPWVCPTNERV